jgi:nicotinamide mononucleotide transporter
MAVIDWLNTPAFSSFGAPTSWAEVLGFAAGAGCVNLVARQVVWNWPVGILNAALWIVLFGTAGLYADSALQVVYIALGCWGWWEWLHGGADRTPLPVSTTTPREWAALAVIGVVATAAMAAFLDRFTASSVPWPDAVTTVLSLLATWGQCLKKLESWVLWMAADVIYVPLYHYKGLTLTALLYVGFFALCIVGLMAWRRDLRAGELAGAVATPAAAASPA